MARTSSAERNRKYRLRQARGIAIYRVAVPHRIVETMIAERRLTDAEAMNPDHIALVVGNIAEEWASLRRK